MYIGKRVCEPSLAMTVCKQSILLLSVKANDLIGWACVIVMR